MAKAKRRHTARKTRYRTFRPQHSRKFKRVTFHKLAQRRKAKRYGKRMYPRIYKYGRKLYGAPYSSVAPVRINPKNLLAEIKSKALWMNLAGLGGGLLAGFTINKVIDNNLHKMPGGATVQHWTGRLKGLALILAGLVVMKKAPRQIGGNIGTGMALMGGIDLFNQNILPMLPSNIRAYFPGEGSSPAAALPAPAAPAANPYNIPRLYNPYAIPRMSGMDTEDLPDTLFDTM
jgi:hypothetical protein